MELLLWLALAFVLVALWRERSSYGPRYRCIITVEPTAGARGNEILCFQPDGTMFRPERRFNRFILEDGE